MSRADDRDQGRGMDFVQRFAASRWAEDRLIEAFKNAGLLAVRIGLSEADADGPAKGRDRRYKVPDLLILDGAALTAEERALVEQEDFPHLDPSGLAPGGRLANIGCKAVGAIEVEFSPYRAAEMAGRNWRKKTAEGLARRPLKHAKPPTAPNIWVKHEDMDPLLAWERLVGAPIVVVHVFDQEAFAVQLREVERLISALAEDPEGAKNLQLTSGIFTKEQTYDRVDAQGAAERKQLFIITPAAAQRAGTVQKVTVKAQLGISKSRKYVTQVLFEGGEIMLDEGFLNMLKSLRDCQQNRGC